MMRRSRAVLLAGLLMAVGCAPGEGERCASEMGSRSGCASELLCVHAGGGGPPTCERKETADATCRDSERCRVGGGCEYDSTAAKCVATSDADCEQSERCQLEGRCTHRQRVCIIAKTADCERSEACKKEGRCQARPDRAAGACVLPPPRLP